MIVSRCPFSFIGLGAFLVRVSRRAGSFFDTFLFALYNLTLPRECALRLCTLHADVCGESNIANGFTANTKNVDTECHKINLNQKLTLDF